MPQHISNWIFISIHGARYLCPWTSRPEETRTPNTHLRFKEGSSSSLTPLPGHKLLFLCTSWLPRQPFAPQPEPIHPLQATMAPPSPAAPSRAAAGRCCPLTPACCPFSEGFAHPPCHWDLEGPHCSLLTGQKWQLDPSAPARNKSKGREMTRRSSAEHWGRGEVPARLPGPQHTQRQCYLHLSVPGSPGAGR